METEVTKRFGEVEVLRQMARSIHGVVKRNVEGFSQEESLMQPQPEGNCLNWVIGHLLHVCNKVLPAVGQEPVLGAYTAQKYQRGSAALKDFSGAADVSELMAAWDEVAKRLDAGLTTLTSKQLDGPAPFSPSNNSKETVRTLLTTVLFHQAYHAGQTGLLRRMAGKPGAIG
jgi:uncharacterized damage-inducible protein DinB